MVSFRSAAGATLLCLATLAVPAAPPACAAPAPLLEVGLQLNRPSVEVACVGGLRIRAREGDARTFLFRHARTVLFEAQGARVRAPWGGTSSSGYVVEALGPGYLQAGGAAYRGSFSVVPAVAGGGLNLIELVDVESYLLGVLKAEMLPSFDPEALKAQAVVSRTFAVGHKDAFRRLGFDVKATEQSQMYGGVAGEDPRTTAAVMATRGQVLHHQGALVGASYHACCGGRTENNEDVWEGKPQPYTRSVRCDFCRGQPGFEWSTELGYDQLQKALAAYGWNLGAIAGIDLNYSETGRVRYVVVITGEGRKVYVPGNKFRIIVDRRRIRSLKFVFADDPVGELFAARPALARAAARADADVASVIQGAMARQAAGKRRLKIVGRGFGHGVGLCQWGAQGMATKGYSFGRILRHYYTQVEVVKAY